MDQLFPHLKQEKPHCFFQHAAPLLLIEDPGGQHPFRVSPAAPHEPEEHDIPAQAEFYADNSLVLINPEGVVIQFAVVDKCLLQDSDQPGQGRCEGMFMYHSHCCWFEIKHQEDWGKARKKAYRQLEDTIQFFRSSHPIAADTVLFALVALLGKRRSPAVSTANQEKRLHFLDNYGVSLIEGNEIRIPLTV